VKNKLLLAGMLTVLLSACSNPFFPEKETKKEINDHNEVITGGEINDLSYTIEVNIIDKGDGDSVDAHPLSGKAGDSVTLDYTVADTAFHNSLVFEGVSVPITSVTGAGSGTGTYTINPDDASDDNKIIIIAVFEHTDLTPDPIVFTDTTPHIVKTYGDEAFTNAITNTYLGSGTISYSSEDETIATVDNNGTVTIGKPGTTVITVRKAADPVYAGAPRAYVLTVRPKPVTITGLGAWDKVYDGTTDATVTGDAVIDGSMPDDDVTVVAGTAAFADRNVGNDKTVSFNSWSLVGADAGNYTVVQPESVTVNITVKPVTITGLGAEDKMYDGTTDVTVTGEAVIDGLMPDDDVTVIAGTAAFSDKNAGEGKKVSFSGWSLAGADAGNYILPAQPEGVTANITPYRLVDKDNLTVIKLTPLNGERDSFVTFNVLPPAEIEPVNITFTHSTPLPSGLSYNAGTLILSYDGETAFPNPDAGNFIVTAVTDNSNYADGIQTFVINVYDGQVDFFGADYDRRIPVTQANITAFNNYANTANGLWRNYKLAEDITLTGTNNWRTIGKNYPATTQFTGSFDGQNNMITGLNINRPTPTEFEQGFFGCISEASSVRNLGLIDGNITGNDYVGGVVGYNFGTVENCYTTGTITGISSLGGVVGRNHGTVQNCYATGDVNGDYNVGGVVGSNEYGMVRNCYATGDVDGDYYVGGAVGYNDSTVENCYTTGTITGIDSAGGVAGSNYGMVENCYATGAVIGNEIVGGVVGHNSDTVENCVALNPSVVTDASDTVIGRVVGYGKGMVILSNNYARNDMVVQHNRNGTGGTDKTITAGLDTADAADITVSQWNTASWWTGTIGWDKAIWDIADGRLPTLMNMPRRNEK
jgi:hypothetical protein